MQEDIRKIRLSLNLTQEELAQRLGISKQYLCSVEKGVKKLQQDKIDELKKICNPSEIKLNIDVANQTSKLNDDLKFESSETLLGIGGLASLIQNYNTGDEFFCYSVKSNSMEPTIPAGSSVLLKYQKTLSRQDNALYLLSLDGEFFIRRIIKNFSELIICADNKEYRPVILKQQEANSLKIVGKVVAVFFS